MEENIITKQYYVVVDKDYSKEKALEDIVPMVSHDEQSLGKFVRIRRFEKKERKNGKRVTYMFEVCFQKRMKPTIPEVLPLVKKYLSLEGNSTGGDYHIVFGDDNVNKSHIEYCLGLAREKQDKLGIQIGELLLGMSKTQRHKLVSLI